MASSPPISITNLVNLSNLERVFSEIYDKISKITTRIDKLESDLSSTVSLSRYLSHENEYSSNINLFESRLKYLEENISLLKPIIDKSKNNEININKIHNKNKNFITNEIYDESLNEFKLNINNKIENISSNTCSNDRIKKLEESTKNVCNQISCMESLIQCKVDKSQVPLIQSCQKQLDKLEEFRDEISERICITDDNISDITSSLNSKLDLNRFNDIYREIKSSLLLKVDMEFLNKEIINRLNVLLPDLLVLLREHKQISITSCFNKIKIIENLINNDLNNKISTNISNIDNILKELYNIPSIQQLQLKSDKLFVENLNKECINYCDNNKNNIFKSINNINNEINQLKDISNKLNDKIQVSLRFVDWYSKLQLES